MATSELPVRYANQRTLHAGELVSSYAFMDEGTPRVVLIGETAYVESIRRAHSAITSPHVATVSRCVHSGGVSHLILDCDAVVDMARVMAWLGAQGEKVTYPVGIALNEIMMDTVEAAHDVSQYLGALCWGNAAIGASGKVWLFGFAHNFPVRPQNAGARAMLGLIEAPEVTMGMAPCAASDVYLLHGWIRSLLPFAEPLELFTNMFAPEAEGLELYQALQALTREVSSLTPSGRPQTVAALRARYRDIRRIAVEMPPPDEGGLRAAFTRAVAAVTGAGAGHTVRLERGAQCVTIDDGSVLDLSRRGALWRLADRIATQHLLAPGVALTLEDLQQAGWPDERVLEQAARARVYVAISTLRKLGMDSVLVRRSDGYLLDAETRVTVA